MARSLEASGINHLLARARLRIKCSSTGVAGALFNGYWLMVHFILKGISTSAYVMTT
jgi:hypothetical protein